MGIQQLAPIDYTTLLGTSDPGAALEAGLQHGQSENAYRQANGNPGGIGAILGGLLGATPSAEMQGKQAELVRQLAQQKASDAALAGVLDNPNPTTADWSRAMIAAPQRFEQIKSAFSNWDKDQQDQTLRDWSAARGYANNGDLEGLRDHLQRRIRADSTRHLDASDDQAILDVVDSDNPDALKWVRNMVDAHFLGALGAQRYAEMFGQLETGRHNRAEENKPTVVGVPLESDAYLVGGAGAVATDGAEGGQAPAQGAPAASTATPAPTGGVYDQVGRISTQLGAGENESAYLRRLVQVESRGQGAARNGSSTGTFQFHPTTFAAAGGGDINSLADQTKAALTLSRHDRAALRQARIEPTDAATYLLHQQGTGGGLALLTAPPDVGAVAALTPVYRNPAIALAAVAGNLGLPYKTPAQRAAANAKAQQVSAGDFVNLWRSRWSGRVDQSRSSGGTSSPPGVQLLRRGVPKAGERWTQIDETHQRNEVTGEVKGVGGPDPNSNLPYRVVGSILAKIAKGEEITDAEQRALKVYRETMHQPDPYGLGGGYGPEEDGSAPAPAATPKPQAVPTYKSAADVKAAYQGGHITRDRASQILRSQFGMQ